MKHKPTSINEPSHRLAISLHMPRANRWWMFCAHFKMVATVSGYCGLKSALRIFTSEWPKVCLAVCVLFNYHGLFMIHIWRGSAGLWKNWLPDEENAGKRPSVHPHSRRPKSHTHCFCHPKPERCMLHLCNKILEKKNYAQFHRNSLTRTKIFP